MEDSLAARPSAIKHDLKLLLWVTQYLVLEPSDFGNNGDDVKLTRFQSAVTIVF